MKRHLAVLAVRGGAGGALLIDDASSDVVKSDGD